MLSCWSPFGSWYFDPNSNDGQKLIGIKTGAADEGAVYAGLAEQCGGVVRLDATAVLDDKRLSRFRVEHLSEAVPNESVRFLGLLRRGVLSAFADRPERFVCDA